jgi:DNA polymerase-4
VIWQAARQVLDRGLTDDLLPVRLLGVGASRLTRAAVVQGDLFDAGRRQRQESLDQTIDTIRGQFGDAAIRRGSLLDRGANGSS